MKVVLNVFGTQRFLILEKIPVLRTFTTFKKNYDTETYLLHVCNYRYRRCIPQFRVSSHILRKETGLHQKPRLPLEQRLCQFVINLKLIQTDAVHHQFQETIKSPDPMQQWPAVHIYIPRWLWWDSQVWSQVMPQWPKYWYKFLYLSSTILSSRYCGINPCLVRMLGVTFHYAHGCLIATLPDETSLMIKCYIGVW